jgi:hypothetical protein
MSNMTTRRNFLLIAGMTGIAGCSANNGNGDRKQPTPSTSAVPSGTASPTEGTSETSSPEPTPVNYELNWTKTSRSQWSPTKLRDGTIYVVGYDVGGNDSNTTLFSLNPTTGRQNWTIEISEYSPGWTFFEVTGDSIITGDTIRNRSDGSVRWQEGFEPQLVLDGSIYAMTSGEDTEERLAKYSLESGAVEWETHGLVSNGRHVASSTGLHNIRDTNDGQFQIVTRDLKTGETLWSEPLPSSWPGLIGASSGMLLGFDAGENKRPPWDLFGIDAESGDKKWEQTLDIFGLHAHPRDPGYVGMNMHVFSNDTLVFPTSQLVEASDGDSGELQFFLRSHQLSDGSTNWQREIPRASTRYDDYALGLVKDEGSLYFARSVANGSVSAKTFKLDTDRGMITTQADIHATSVSGNQIIGWVPGSGQYGISLAMAEPST